MLSQTFLSQYLEFYTKFDTNVVLKPSKFVLLSCSAAEIPGNTFCLLLESQQAYMYQVKATLTKFMTLNQHWFNVFYDIYVF